MRSSFNRRLELWREYSEISEVADIARRAFANNSFDGVLTMMGVVMGNYVVGVEDASVVLITGMSTAVAIGISGGWGAYLTESAERRHDMVELERAVLTPLGASKIGRASRMAVWVVAAVDGLSPFLSAFFVVIPFLFAAMLPRIEYVYYASIAMALIGLFGLGIYLAYIAQVPKIKLGLKTMIAGIVSIAVSFGIELITQ